MVPALQTLLLLVVAAAAAYAVGHRQAASLKAAMSALSDTVRHLTERLSTDTASLEATTSELDTATRKLNETKAELADARHQAGEAEAQLAAETVRREAADAALFALEGADALPPLPTPAEYLEQVRVSGYDHIGPVIEFRPGEVAISPTEALPPALLVRLPLAGYSTEQLEQQVRLAMRRGAQLAPGHHGLGLATKVEWSEPEGAVRVQNLANIGPLLYGVPSFGPTLVVWTVNLRERCAAGCRDANSFTACACQCGGMYHGRSDGTPWPGWTDAGYRRSYTDGQREKKAVLTPEWWTTDQAPPAIAGPPSGK